MSARQLDREDAEVAGVVVHLDGRVTRRARRLLVGGEERILERGDERALLDSLVALDLADGLDDLLAHVTLPLVDQICPHDLGVRDLGLGAVRGGDRHALLARGENLPAQLSPGRCGAWTRRPSAASKCSCRRNGRSGPGEDTSTLYSRR